MILQMIVHLHGKIKIQIYCKLCLVFKLSVCINPTDFVHPGVTRQHRKLTHQFQWTFNSTIEVLCGSDSDRIKQLKIKRNADLFSVGKLSLFVTYHEMIVIVIKNATNV